MPDHYSRGLTLSTVPGFLTRHQPRSLTCFLRRPRLRALLSFHAVKERSNPIGKGLWCRKWRKMAGIFNSFKRRPRKMPRGRFDCRRIPHEILVAR